MLDLGSWNFPWHTYMIGAVSNVVLLVVGLLFSVILPAPLQADPNLTLWGWLRKKSVARVPATQSAILDEANSSEII
jgi:SSS family solute:Na+ symporter